MRMCLNDPGSENDLDEICSKFGKLEVWVVCFITIWLDDPSLENEILAYIIKSFIIGKVELVPYCALMRYKIFKPSWFDIR